MRRKLAALVTGLLLLGATGAMAQGPGGSNGNGPDPDGPAAYGLCKAYFSGNGGENGKKNDAPPFANLKEHAEEETGEEGDEAVRQYCESIRPSNGQGNGSGNSNAPSPVPGD